MAFLFFISSICLSSRRQCAIITNGVKQVSKTYAPYCPDFGQIAQMRIVKIDKWHLIQGNQSSQNGEDQEPVLHVYAPTIKNALFLMVTESAGTKVFTHQFFSLARATQIKEFRNRRSHVKLQ